MLGVAAGGARGVTTRGDLDSRRPEPTACGILDSGIRNLGVGPAGGRGGGPGGPRSSSSSSFSDHMSRSESSMVISNRSGPVVSFLGALGVSGSLELPPPP